MPLDFHQTTWDAAIEDDLRHIVRLAVREDLDRHHDWTTVALVAAETQGRAAIVSRQPGVICGLNAIAVAMNEMHADINFDRRASDGDSVTPGQVVAELHGSARDLLTCERVLLNLLGRLSGIATLTREYVQRIEGAAANIYDTRKTIPGWRRLEKYAVRCGGGYNHRSGLYDAILIKDNHLALASQQALSAVDAVQKAREFLKSLLVGSLPPDLLVEVEVDSLAQLEEVLRAEPDIVLLDNLAPDQLREAVSIRNRKAPSVQLEASGGVTLGTIREVALTGVDRISVGALTHTVRWLDVGLDWIETHNQ